MHECRGEAMESARQEVVKAKIRFSRGLGASFEANSTRAIHGPRPSGASRYARAHKTAPAVLWQPRIPAAQTPMPHPQLFVRAPTMRATRASPLQHAYIYTYNLLRIRNEIR